MTLCSKSHHHIEGSSNLQHILGIKKTIKHILKTLLKNPKLELPNVFLLIIAAIRNTYAYLQLKIVHAIAIKAEAAWLTKCLSFGTRLVPPHCCPDGMFLHHRLAAKLLYAIKKHLMKFS